MNHPTPLAARNAITKPEQWHRTLCPVTEQLLLCGDLAPGDAAARAQLDAWVDAGITHILDVRLDCEVRGDVEFVATHAPQITYLRAGVDDAGGRRDDAWFDAGVAAVLEALTDPTVKVVVHCHMGVNRGPSMAFAALLADGWAPIPALEAIRAARPIAAVLYAPDAVAWWMQRTGAPNTEVAAARTDVIRWGWANAIDTSWIISRIRLAS